MQFMSLTEFRDTLRTATQNSLISKLTTDLLLACETGGNAQTLKHTLMAHKLGRISVKLNERIVQHLK